MTSSAPLNLAFADECLRVRALLRLHYDSIDREAPIRYEVGRLFKGTIQTYNRVTLAEGNALVETFDFREGLTQDQWLEGKDHGSVVRSEQYSKITMANGDYAARIVGLVSGPYRLTEFSKAPMIGLSIIEWLGGFPAFKGQPDWLYVLEELRSVPCKSFVLDDSTVFAFNASDDGVDWELKLEFDGASRLSKVSGERNSGGFETHFLYSDNIDSHFPTSIQFERIGIRPAYTTFLLRKLEKGLVVPSEIFRLPHYGIDEPSVPKQQPLYSGLILIFVGVFLILVRVYWVKKRKLR